MKAGRVFENGRRIFFPTPIRVVTASLAVLMSFPAQSATLDKIAQTGTIIIGYRESSPPFSYLDEAKNPIGYSVDLCLKVVEAVKRELKRPNVTVKFVPVTSASRMKAVMSDEVDLECGSTTSTAERRKEVAFTVPTFVAATRLMVREGGGIKSIYDLSGKTVVTTGGTSSEKLFTDLNDARTLRAKLVLTKDHAESFAMLETGKADAFIMDDVLLYSLRAGSKEPEKYIVTRDALTIEPLSIMLRKDDPAFKKVVDSEVTRVILQGEINAMYRKWFESPIPPKQINLKIPMSFMLRDSFKTPTDWLPK